MNVSLEKHWRDMVDDLVQRGRYESPNAVVREGLRLVEEREAKLQALREATDATIAEGGSLTPEDVAAPLDAEFADLAELDGPDQKLEALRLSLADGEASGPTSAFDFDAFIAGKRDRRR